MFLKIFPFTFIGVTDEGKFYANLSNMHYTIYLILKNFDVASDNAALN